MRSTTLDLFFLTVLAAGLVYFAVDAWFGASGGWQSVELRAEIERLESEIETIEEQRVEIDAKIRRLSGAQIDPELLDERLRAVLGVLGENDAYILEQTAAGR